MKKMIFSALAILFIYIFVATKEYRILATSELGNYTFDPNVTEIKSDKTNIKAFLFEEHSNPIVAINATFTKAGSANNKITNFIPKVITDNQKIQEELEINGISLVYSTSLDEFNVSILAPKKSLNTALDIFVKTFYQPDIKASSIQKAKEQLLLGLKHQTEHPSSILSLEFNKALYGQHPYAQNPLGTSSKIKQVTKKDIIQYIKTAFAKDNIIIALAGDINQSEAISIIDTMFYKLPNNSQTKEIADIKPHNVDVNINHPAAQVISVFAAPISKRSAADFYPLYLANYILGGNGLSSKLSQTIREENGLVYSVYSYLSYHDNANIALMSYSTSKDKQAAAKKLFEEQIKDFYVSNSDLRLAKKSLINANNLRFAKITDISNFLIYMQKHNLGLDFLSKRNEYINNVNKEDVNKAIKKYYNINNFRKMTIGA